MELQPNELLRDRYQIEEQLGKGGMGAVYAAHDTVLDTRVAVKVNQNPQPEGQAQFLNEARLLAALRHPNLPRVIDYFVIDNNQFLVMDLVPGEDLGSLVKREGIQPVEKVLGWAKQLGDALNYLHQQKPPVIHRDIKPANIKLTPSGNIMLVDFGIAKAVDISQETSTGARGMTPGYSPPEQYGTARTGPYSDQFALASTLYNLLTNQKPVDAVERLLGQAKLTPMHLLNPKVPPKAQATIEHAMAVKPEDRFPSVQAFIDTLLDSESKTAQPAKTEPARFSTPVTPVVSTDRTVVGTPAAQPPAAQPISQPVSQPKKKRVWWLIPLILIPVLGLFLGGGWFVFSQILNPTGTTPPQPSPTVVDFSVSVSETLAAMPTEEPTSTPTEAPTQAPTDIPTNTPEPTLQPTATPALTAIGRGGLVAYASNAADKSTFQIWTMRVYYDDFGELIALDKTQLTDSTGNKYYPSWSPDGTQLVYSAESGDETNKLDLYVMDADGQNQALLVTHPGDDTEPVWSPDGEWIVFTSDSRTDGILQLYVIHPDGSDLQRISFDKQEFSPEWSPRMDKLVFILPVNNARYLWVRDPKDNFADTNSNLMFGRLGWFNEPAWSPDGEWLAYTKEEGRTKDIYVTQISSYGMDISRLTNTTYDSYPAWSSDSQWLLFNSNRDGNMEIYVMNSAGNLQTNLTLSADSDEIQPAWQIK